MITAPLLLIALLSMLSGILSGRYAVRLWLVGNLAGAVFAALAASEILLRGGDWEWQGSFDLGGETVHLYLDALGAFFLLLIAVIGGATTVYSREYWSDQNHPGSAKSGRFWWSSLLLLMGLVVMCSNGLHFLLVWEAFAISAYFLITLDRQKREVRAAGWLYLVASHAGTLCLFGLFAALAAKMGSWDLGDLRSQSELAPLFWLVLLGFGVKAGLFSLHIWLPSAHANAPSHVSAILSGVAIKMGIYGIIRFSGWLPVAERAAWAVAIIGVVSAVLGVVFALGQHDLKRLLAYHSVENVGIILMGVGFGLVALNEGHAVWGQLALIGGLLHVWNHGLFKSLLFLGAGSVLHATGTREMSQLGGLWRKMPWTAGLFALGAIAIVGLPPLNGFVSEFLIYLGMLEAVNSHSLVSLPIISAVVLLAVTGALALACFIKVCGVVFLGAPRTEAAKDAHECGRLMRWPMVLIGGLCVLIGLLPVLVWIPVSHAATAWHPEWTTLPTPVALNALTIAHLVVGGCLLMGVGWFFNKVRAMSCAVGPTWDCGYAQPDPKIQYTAGSFAEIITGWFERVLRRERHLHRPQGLFPDRAHFTEHTPETVLEMVFKPATHRVMQMAAVARGFQHGRVQSYLFYLISGVLLIAIITAWTAWR